MSTEEAAPAAKYGFEGEAVSRRGGGKRPTRTLHKSTPLTRGHGRQGGQWHLLRAGSGSGGGGLVLHPGALESQAERAEKKEGKGE